MGAADYAAGAGPLIQKPQKGREFVWSTRVPVKGGTPEQSGPANFFAYWFIVQRCSIEGLPSFKIFKKPGPAGPRF